MKNFGVLTLSFLLLLTACRPKTGTVVSPPILPETPAAVTAPVTGGSSMPASPVPSTGAAVTTAPSAVPPRVDSAAEADPNDPAEIQRRFVKTINDGIRKAEAGLKTPVTIIVNNETHTYFAEYDGKLTYDIKKTDSIVSPMLGTVSWSVRWYHNGIATNVPATLDAHYAYQNGKWIIRDLIRRADDGKPVSAEEYLPLFQ